jgi:4-alpha-glucanotransferase
MNTRGSGILLHITSLPSPFGIGDLGPQAYKFAEFLFQAQQSYWQVLPLNPTDQACGNSPYSSISAYAGNTMLISPELLLDAGFLTDEDVAEVPQFPASRCDYSTVIPYKVELLRRAYNRFKVTGIERAAFNDFCVRHRDWLDDYALFVVIKNLNEGKIWNEWAEAFRDRDAKSLKHIKNDCRDEVECEQFLQYLFFKQWLSLKTYCNERGIRIIGDIPIYVNFDSADVWMNTGIFKLDKEKKPLCAAGVPPDYFSATGQLWGNPVYRWEVLAKTKFKWWLQRIAHNLTLIDVLRIDHFRGFVAFWEVPAPEKTAVNGTWVAAPATAFFNALVKKFPSIPLIAEDLGLITDDVREVMKRFGFPGMKVLQFAFGEDLPTHPYLPHNYLRDCVVYTGTHDNNTTRGWFEHEATPEEKVRLSEYLGREISAEEVSISLIQLAMMSAANTAIFPLQDILGLGEDARMNRPSTARGNWEWRCTADQNSTSAREKLLALTRTYGRISDTISTKKQ